MVVIPAFLKQSRRMPGFVPYLSALVVLAGCTATEPTAAGNTVSGTYALSITRSAAACAPQPLPAPVGTDASQYEDVPTANITTSGIFDVVQKDSLLTVTPSTRSGSKALSVSGLYPRISADPTLLTGARVLNEAPRVGGHTFTAQVTVLDTAVVTLAITTLPGATSQAALTARGTRTITFRDNAPTGSVYTTCVVAEQLGGTRME